MIILNIFNIFWIWQPAMPTMLLRGIDHVEKSCPIPYNSTEEVLSCPCSHVHTGWCVITFQRPVGGQHETLNLLTAICQAAVRDEYRPGGGVASVRAVLTCKMGFGAGEVWWVCGPCRVGTDRRTLVLLEAIEQHRTRGDATCTRGKWALLRDATCKLQDSF